MVELKSQTNASKLARCMSESHYNRSRTVTVLNRWSCVSKKKERKKITPVLKVLYTACLICQALFSKCFLSSIHTPMNVSECNLWCSTCSIFWATANLWNWRNGYRDQKHVYFSSKVESFLTSSGHIVNCSFWLYSWKFHLEYDASSCLHWMHLSCKAPTSSKCCCILLSRYF